MTAPFDEAELPRPPMYGDLSGARLALFDAAGEELVKALAAADLARQPRITTPATSAPIDADMMEPAPMIIERARAEQELGLRAATPEVPWANPMRGLGIGFSLSLFTGAALYLMLTSG